MATRHQRSKLTSRPGLRRRFRPLLESVERRQLLAVVVTSSADSGENTLRDAIEQVNAGLVDDDTIHFDIQETSLSGPVTIFLNSELPELTHPVHIQGLTQPGATPNDQFDADNANLQIILNGTSEGFRGLVFAAGSDGSDVSGLVFRSFTRNVIEIDASDVHVFGNYIGVAQSGSLTSDSANASDGVAIVGGSGNTVGGLTLAERNLITSNAGNGISITNSDANSIVGNFIGVDASGGFVQVVEGAPRAGNGLNGVAIFDGNANTLGGTTPNARNIISANQSDGIHIDGGDGNAVLSGIIGLTTNGNPLGNVLDGVLIVATQNTRVGVPGNTERNVISGNGDDGVDIQDGRFDGSDNFIATRSTSLYGNYIGLDPTGVVARPNVNQGVFTLGDDNIIGEGNFISGNQGSGLIIWPSAIDTSVTGSTFGLNVLGIPLPNSDGIGSSGHGVTIGGTTRSEWNVISSNLQYGIRLGGISSEGSIEILGNLIGLDPSGMSDRGNGAGGITIAALAPSITIDGAYISGNGGEGVNMYNVTTIRNSFIGLGIDGLTPIGNERNGILVDGNATDSTIGGPAGSGRNVISGNGTNGILVRTRLDRDARLSILGNYIGLDVTGSIGVGNAENGISYLDSHKVEVGGIGGGNVISGNGLSGISVINSSSQGAPPGGSIVANTIGLNAAGTAVIPNRAVGIYLNNFEGITVGGPSPQQRNVISGNFGDGVRLENIGDASGAPVGPILGNVIGLDPTGQSSFGNGGNGIAIIDVNDFTIGGTGGGGNLIAGNGANGIFIDGEDSEVRSNGGSIVANTIGLDITGTSARPNQFSGIHVSEVAGVSIGGTTPGSGNVISGNVNHGVLLENLGSASGAFSGLILGNTIGLDPTGRTAIGNTGKGIWVYNSDSVTIGSVNGGGNLISGNRNEGIVFENRDVETSLSGGSVVANTIGLNVDGTAALGNGSHGVFINNVSRVTVGGAGAGEGNVVSGNAGDGVRFQGLPSFSRVFGSVVLGNTIGLGRDGRGVLGNGQNGVAIVDGESSTVGGAGAGRNLISGNNHNGIILLNVPSEEPSPVRQAGATEILGNIVGLDLQGNAAGNGGDGLSIQGIPGVVVGSDTDPLAGNVFSANGRNGIAIVGADSGAAEVFGNSVGAGLDGLADRGNQLDGILISGAAGNAIGGEGPAGNVLSANRGNGIQIVGGDASGNRLIGNAIGVDRGGNRPLGNGNDGVFINGAPGNSVGIVGPPSTLNVISNNGAVGVEIVGQGASGNSIVNNFIGLGRDGFSPLANGEDGIFVDNAPGNTIGVPAAPNVISNPAPITEARVVTVGIQLFGPGATGNVIRSNRIGTDATGTADRGSTVGVFINNAPNNTVGGSSAELGNLISGNDDANVQIVGRLASGNQVANNTIGLALGGTARLTVQTIRNLATFISDPERINDPRTLVGLQIDGATGTLVLSNVISDNRVGVGITGVGANSVLLANRIGVQATGDLVGPNGPLNRTGNDTGVFVNNSSGNFIGAPGFVNEIRFNRGVGLEFFGPASSGNLVRSNVIGQNGDGVYFEGARDNLIGGDATTDGNDIVGNRSTGVYFFSTATTGNAVRSNRITDSGQYGALFFNTRLNNRVPQNGAGANLFARNAVANVRIFNGRAVPASIISPATRSALARRPALGLSASARRPTA